MGNVAAKKWLRPTDSSTSGVRPSVGSTANSLGGTSLAEAYVAAANGSRPPSRVSGVVPAAGRAPVSQRSGPVSYRGVGPRVLLIEDDAVTRSKLEQMLSKRGAEVISASGPSEALYLLSTLDTPSGRSSIVILDVLMPGLDGPLFVNMLRSDARLAGAPVVLISALSAPALEQTMRDWRADGFILKSRGLLHIDDAFEAWFARLAMKISGHPASRGSGRPPSSNSIG